MRIELDKNFLRAYPEDFWERFCIQSLPHKRKGNFFWIPKHRLSLEQLRKKRVDLKIDPKVAVFLKYYQDILNWSEEKKRSFKEFRDSRLYPHQVAALNLLKVLGRLALFLEMGLGKTIIFLKAIENDFKGKSLIVAPLITLKSIKKKAEEWTSLKAGIYPEKGDLIITNYEKLLVRQEFFREKWDWIVLDESQKIKTPSAKRTLAALRLQGKKKIISTGTPLLKNVMDLYSQFSFLGRDILGFTSFSQFKKYYGIWGGYGGFQLVGQKNVDDLLERIKFLTFHLRKEDCLYLPEKVFEIVNFDLSREQKKAYREIKNYIPTLLKGEKINVTNILAQYLRLQQITSGIFFEKNPKLEALLEILSDFHKQGIIWARFREDVFSIKKNLKSSEMIYGDVSQKKRDEILENFKKGNFQFLVLQVQTASLGIDLEFVDFMVFFSNTFSYGDRVQAESRCHRIGQKNSVTIVDLLANNTIDETILRCLQKKKDFEEEILGSLKEN